MCFRRRVWYWHKKQQQRLDGEAEQDGGGLREKAEKATSERSVADLTRGRNK